MSPITLIWTLTLGALAIAAVVGGLVIWIMSMVARTARGEFEID